MSAAAGERNANPAAATGRPMSAQTFVVTIHVPARPEYVPILRAACGQLAPLLDCTLEEVVDLWLAVDEATGFLLRNCVAVSRGAEQDDLSATFVITGPGLRITLSRTADVSVRPDDDDFGWAILTALVDSFTWGVRGSTVRVDIRKQHAGGR
ncbi:serine/threonine-protein kinase RsbW [Catenulispora sp. GP43]|uniref:anti-sigma regulatory factor n=1 Tax=Catenulispora sp. GP43 TaxID=3156263 RepID=UPI00351402F8